MRLSLAAARKYALIIMYALISGYGYALINGIIMCTRAIY